MKFLHKVYMNIPQRYIPKSLSFYDTGKQRRNINKSRKLYKKGVYFTRPKVKTFKSKPSQHIKNAMKMYGVKKVVPNRELSRKTKCSLSSLQKIVSKGEGAYFSSGSRPNQTARSWGLARLASSVTGGKASIVDYDILKNGCQSDSKALRAATRTCHKAGKCKNKTVKKSPK